VTGTARFLLDTHVWLWMVARPDRLSTEARSLLENVENVLLFSAASSWEIAIKHALGKLVLPDAPSRYVPAQIEKTGVTPLPVEHSHALHVADLPPHHRDPFDRLLVAQARLERVPIVTTDARFRPYDVAIVAV
jgi:PIN domain nuclease of toxin-antitoxin system